MLWPFNHFRKPRLAPAGTIGAIYGMIVTQAREPIFYRDLGVPDTVNGRFDLLLLHLWLMLRRLKSVDDGTALSQGLFDHFCNDMDDNLRELGVSDLKVPKRMQAFGEAFYGRTAAYDMALTDSPEDIRRHDATRAAPGGEPSDLPTPSFADPAEPAFYRRDRAAELVRDLRVAVADEPPQRDLA